MTSKTPAGVPLSDADLLKLMTANGPAIARIVENASRKISTDANATKSDDEVLAAEHAAAVRVALAPVCAAIDKAKADGYVVTFGLAEDANGKQAMVQFAITKTYAI
jgi:hypothetical protein